MLGKKEYRWGIILIIMVMMVLIASIFALKLLIYYKKESNRILEKAVNIYEDNSSLENDFELNSSVFEVYSMNKTHVNFTAVIYPNSTIVSDSADNLSGMISNNRCYWYLECY